MHEDGVLQGLFGVERCQQHPDHLVEEVPAGVGFGAGATELLVRELVEFGQLAQGLGVRVFECFPWPTGGSVRRSAEFSASRAQSLATVRRGGLGESVAARRRLSETRVIPLHMVLAEPRDGLAGEDLHLEHAECLPDRGYRGAPRRGPGLVAAG